MLLLQNQTSSDLPNTTKMLVNYNILILTLFSHKMSHVMFVTYPKRFINYYR